MRSSILPFILLLAVPSQSQVLDVDDDGIVGPAEAIAVAEDWKGPATSANDHNHLGQTWTGNRNQLVIQGLFPPELVIGTGKEESKGVFHSFPAPLILENDAFFSPSRKGEGTQSFPDLILGEIGVLEGEGELHLRSNRSLSLRSETNIFHFYGVGGEGDVKFVYGPNRSLVRMTLDEAGNLSVVGNCSCQGRKTKLDHPLDPANKYLIHASVDSPEMKNVYDGVVTLDEAGETLVQLPHYFETFNTDFRYQLTPIGASAPNLYVAQEIQDNRFRIAGGVPGMKVSWQVTGVRQDAFAKAHRVEVEKEKLEEEKGKYLHPRE